MTIAIIGLLGFLIMRHVLGFIVESFQRKRTPLEKVIPTTASIPAPKHNRNASKEDCEVYLTRLFEERLVAANVIELKDMTICENGWCQNCMPTRGARKSHERALMAAASTPNEIREADMNVPVDDLLREFDVLYKAMRGGGRVAPERIQRYRELKAALGMLSPAKYESTYVKRKQELESKYSYEHHQKIAQHLSVPEPLMAKSRTYGDYEVHHA